MANVKQYSEGNTRDTDQPIGELVYVGDNTGGKLRVYVEPNKFIDIGTPTETDPTFAYSFSQGNTTLGALSGTVTLTIPHNLGRVPKFVSMRGSAYDGANQYWGASKSYGTVENWNSDTDSGDNQYEGSMIAYHNNYTPAIYNEMPRVFETKATRVNPVVCTLARRMMNNGATDQIWILVTEMTDAQIVLQVTKNEAAGSITGYFQMELR